MPLLIILVALTIRWYSEKMKISTKGQITSKGLFGILGFFQKTNEQIRFY